MPSVRIRLPTEELREGLERIRAEMHVPEGFPPEVEREARESARGAPPSSPADRTGLPMLTIDPPGSRDLDQAFFAERRPGGGYRVSYAIADVASFVVPGGEVDREAWRRAQTLYLPDRRVPLYPTVLSEGSASLLPNVERPAILYTIDLDDDGRDVGSHVERAVVRSRRAASYRQVQSELDAEEAEEPLALLREIGLRRMARDRERGGITLDLPVQEVVRADHGYRFRTEAQLPVERWNAQISLLTGHRAAELMVHAGAGILRTVPPVDDRGIARLRRVARVLDIAWEDAEPLGEAVRQCDDATAVGAAFLTQAAHVLRGAGYTVLHGRPPVPPIHGGLGLTYAHVTAPLRRLADRYANEIAVALAAAMAPPAWVTEALPRLPDAMARGDHHADAVEAAVVNLAEALVMSGREGQTFRAMVVDVNHDRATVQVADPPVVVRIPALGRTLGEALEVRLVEADPVSRRVVLEPARAGSTR